MGQISSKVQHPKCAKDGGPLCILPQTFAGTMGYLLDEINSNAKSAVAEFVLSQSFSNSDIVRLRRDSDNAESNFTYAEYFNGTAFTWSQAAGSANIFRVTRFDQSGNAINRTQSTAADQVTVGDASGLFTSSNGAFIGKKEDAVLAETAITGLSGTDGAVILFAKPIGGNLAGRFWTATNYTGNPAVGRADENGTDTFNPSIGSGTPTTEVNSVILSPNTRGQLGTEWLNTEAVVIIYNINWSASSNWNIRALEDFGYMDAGSEIGAIIYFDTFDTDDISTIKTIMNNEYATV